MEILDKHEGTHSAGFKIASADVSAALATNLRWRLDGTARAIFLPPAAACCAWIELTTVD